MGHINMLFNFLLFLGSFLDYSFMYLFQSSVLVLSSRDSNYMQAEPSLSIFHLDQFLSEPFTSSSISFSLFFVFFFYLSSMFLSKFLLQYIPSFIPSSLFFISEVVLLFSSIFPEFGQLALHFFLCLTHFCVFSFLNF